MEGHMSKGHYLLGIDIGTSGLKALLTSADGKTAALEHQSYDPDVLPDGGVEQHPLVWWNAAVSVLRCIAAAHPDKMRDVAGVGLGGQMHGLVALDGAGEPVCPAVIWMDARSHEQVRRVYDAMGEECVHAVTLNRVCPGFALPSLLWLRDSKPEVFGRIRYIMQPKDYIRFRLTGRIATDVSDASATSAFDTIKRQWAWALIDALALDRGLFPACLESDGIAGEVTAQAAAETGLAAGTPVIYGGGDQPVQSVGNGAVTEGVFCSSIGTSGQISLFSEKPLHDSGCRVHTFCHAVRGGWSVFGATLSAGLCLKWLNNSMMGAPGYEVINRMAAETPPGSGGVVFLPYLNGERTPHFDSGARGLFIGLSLSHDIRYMARAVMEGVVFSLKESLNLLAELCGRPRDIIAAGGGSKSPLWLQMQADIFEMPVRVVEDAEQVSLGAAMLAGVGTGVFRTYEQAAEAMVRYDGTLYEPDSRNAGVYRDAYRRYRALYGANRTLFRPGGEA
jgi:xylulokinase